MLKNGMMVLALALLSGGSVYGDAVWGIESVVEIASYNGPSTFPEPFQFVTFMNGLRPVHVTSYISPVLSASGSYTFGGSTVSGSATAWDTVTSGPNGVGFHGFVTATLSGLCTTCRAATENEGFFRLDFFDVLTIGGLPSGTPVDLKLTGILHSISTAGGSGNTSTVRSDALFFGNQEVLLQNNDGNANGTLIGSAVVHTMSGATLNFLQELDTSIKVADFLNFQTGTVDASNTANAYISVLTPGASYTSASELRYNTPPSAVAEPASLWLAGTTLLSICFLRRHSGSRVHYLAFESLASRPAGACSWPFIGRLNDHVAGL